jgi:hypothetical protein
VGDISPAVFFASSGPAFQNQLSGEREKKEKIMNPLIRFKTTIVLITVLSAALPAVAEKPTIEPFPFTSLLVSSADACGFDVLFTPQAGRPNRERLIEFANTTIIVGPLFVTLTNLSTGKTIDLNISGPGQFHFTTNTFVGEGPSIPGPLPTDVATAAGVPLLPLFHGRVVYTFDAQGNLISISFTGPVEDVCQLLQ